VGRLRDGRPEYVVELQVAGVAVVSVRAESHDDAVTQAENRVRPVDVTELHEVTGVTVVKVSEAVAAGVAPPSSSGPERPSKAVGHGG
jgi:hypothetical protein